MNDRIEKRIELKAPVSRVWRALTDYREFGEWFRVKLDGPFVPGQVARGHITYPGYEHLKWEAVVQAMEVERLFSFTWHPYAVDPKTDYHRPARREARARDRGGRGAQRADRRAARGGEDDAGAAPSRNPARARRGRRARGGRRSLGGGPAPPRPVPVGHAALPRAASHHLDGRAHRRRTRPAAG